MKISAHITGTRNNQEITIPVTLTEGALEIEVPSVNRAASCSFSVE